MKQIDQLAYGESLPYGGSMTPESTFDIPQQEEERNANGHVYRNGNGQKNGDIHGAHGTDSLQKTEEANGFLLKDLQRYSTDALRRELLMRVAEENIANLHELLQGKALIAEEYQSDRGSKFSRVAEEALKNLAAHHPSDTERDNVDRLSGILQDLQHQLRRKPIVRTIADLEKYGE